MNITTNINDIVKVKLTDLGVSILLEKHNDFNDFMWEKGIRRASEFKEFEVKRDEEGYTSFQLWDLMNIFGPYLTLGTDIPFETDIILTYEIKD